MTSSRTSTTSKAGSKAAASAKAARRKEAGTEADAGTLTRQRRRVPARKASDNPLFAGLAEHDPADAAAQKRRLGIYARLLQDAMRVAQLDEAALVHLSMLPEQVVRDALAGAAAPYGYAQYALAEPLGLDSEEVARQVIAMDAETQHPSRRPASQPASPLVAEAPPDPATEPAAPGGAAAAGTAPIVTHLAGDRVRLTFPQPVVLPQPVADALLSLLKFRLD